MTFTSWNYLKKHIQDIAYDEAAGQEYGNDAGNCHPLWMMIVGSHDFFFSGGNQTDNENKRDNEPIQRAGQNQKVCRPSDHGHQEGAQGDKQAGDELFMCFQPWM